MTLKQGMNHFLKSDTYKLLCKKQNSEGMYLRNIKKRYRGGKLKREGIISTLQKYGYKVGIDVVPPKENSL